MRNKTFAQILKEEREKQGLNRKELGRKAGCSGVAIKNYETEKRSPPLKYAENILKALGKKIVIEDVGEEEE